LSTWQQLIGYCRTCATWRDALPHTECEVAADSSALLLNYGEGLLTCTSCQQVWLTEETQIICPACGQPQQIRFVEDTIELQPEDLVLAIEGALAYILAQSGALVIAPRRGLALSDSP
jgi:hypothetical protein